MDFSIWVDCDSCPVKVREVIAKAANRLQKKCYFVANRAIPFLQNDFTTMVVVESGEGIADDYITENCNANDLAITRDIPLAKRLLEKNLVVLNDRGEIFTLNQINERLSIRNFMYELRSSGINIESQSNFSARELQKFAAAFDKETRKLLDK